MADEGDRSRGATQWGADGQQDADENVDPITAALAAAVQARRQGGGDRAVLAAMRQAADYCRTRLQETLEQAVAEAEQAQQRFIAAQAGHDEAEKAQRFTEGQAAIHHAEAVEQQVRQALLDLADGVIELSEPALQRLQRAVVATQRLVEQAEPQN